MTDPLLSQSRSDGYDYVRQAYAVEIDVGDEVTVDGRRGTVVQGNDDQYIYVREWALSGIWKCHPTWRFSRVLLSREPGSEDR